MNGAYLLPIKTVTMMGTAPLTEKKMKLLYNSFQDTENYYFSKETRKA